MHAIDDEGGYGLADQHLALCAYAYHAQCAMLRQRLDEFGAAREIPQLFRILAMLHQHILLGSDEGLPRDLVPSDTTAFDNELAVLRYVVGDLDGGDALMRRRYEYLVSTGNTYQGYTVSFAGGLFATLAPPDCSPATTWLDEQLTEPDFPGIWVWARALVALLIAERNDDRSHFYATTARRLRAQFAPDLAVRAWFDPRLDALER